VIGVEGYASFVSPAPQNWPTARSLLNGTQRLLRVMFVAQWRPIGLIPEQFVVAFVRNDVVDFGGSHKMVVSLALDTEWISGQECQTCASPLCIIIDPSSAVIGARHFICRATPESPGSVLAAPVQAVDDRSHRLELH
jgi:hypothetical protein